MEKSRHEIWFVCGKRSRSTLNCAMNAEAAGGVVGRFSRYNQCAWHAFWDRSRRPVAVCILQVICSSNQFRVMKNRT